MLKKIFISLFLVTFIFSCWKSENLINDSWLKDITRAGYSMQIPTNWEVIEDIESILPTPRAWEIELAITSTNFENWFANNLLILSENLNRLTTSKEYSMLNNIWAETDYLEYTKLESKDIKFVDWAESIVYIFEAKYNLESPRLKFLQTANICGANKAYFMTIAIPTDVRDTSRYEYLLSSFKCR